MRRVPSGPLGPAERPVIPSLPEVFASIKVPRRGGFLRKLAAFAGPAYLVSVGYMDPGNWATDIEGGARFGYRLLWVLLLSNVMAIFLQTLWRWIEAVVVLFVAATMTCFAVELFIAQPDWVAAAAGLTHPSLDHESLYVAIAIIGATVMPHNLYLHSALVQTRAVGRSARSLAEAARFNVADSLVALNLRSS